MNSRDKKAWLNEYGYTRFERKDKDTGLITVQWTIYFKVFLYTGRGFTRYEAYDDLYDTVKETLYSIC